MDLGRYCVNAETVSTGRHPKQYVLYVPTMRSSYPTCRDATATDCDQGKGSICGVMEGEIRLVTNEETGISFSPSRCPDVSTIFPCPLGRGVTEKHQIDSVD